MPLLSGHAYEIRGTRGLYFGLILYHPPYFVYMYASSEGSGESAYVGFSEPSLRAKSISTKII